MIHQRFLAAVSGTAALVLFSLAPTQAQDPRGALCIIGGGDHPPGLMKQFLELAGGPDKARIAVIPNASADGDTSCHDMAEEFAALGATHVTCCLLDRTQASDPASASLLDGITGVYFTGGDQVRITKALEGTPFHQRLLAMYREGAVMAGTSAGAAIMSRVMITGDERINKDSNNIFHTIQKDNVITVDGMGFLTNVIIDQHFVKRKRLNRLISVVLEHPELVGVGIDESTAIVVRAGRRFTVVGPGTVVIVDATHAKGIRTDKQGNLSAQGVTLDVLQEGDSYDIPTRTVVPGGAPQ